METDRRRVFELLRMGRITAAEAERLMSAWQANRESTWILAGCIAMAVAAQVRVGEVGPAVVHVAHGLRTLLLRI
jgi:small ligand-binding sensory domain FIST